MECYKAIKNVIDKYLLTSEDGHDLLMKNTL